MVPLHVLLKPLGLEMTSPAGRVSVKPMPDSPTVALGLLRAKLKLVEPLSGILAAPKDLLIVGGETTVMLAVEVFPVPPSFELTVTVLFLIPGVVPVTLTETAHEPLAAMVPLLRLTTEEPPVAVTVPLQVLVILGVEATTRPEGRLSVNATPVRPMVFGLLMLKLKVVVPLSGMLAAPNDLMIDGGLATLRFAVAVLPVPPLVEDTAPVVLV